MTALLTIGLAATRISEIMAPPTKPKGEITFRQQSLVSARADFVLFWSLYPMQLLRNYNEEIPMSVN